MVASTLDAPHNLKLVAEENSDVPALEWLLEMQQRCPGWGLPELAAALGELHADLLELATAAHAIARDGLSVPGLERLDRAVEKVGFRCS